MEAISADGAKLFKHNAYLVIRGFPQHYGAAYEEQLVMMVQFARFRIFFAIGGTESLELDQIHVQKAFLQGNINEGILLSRPKGIKMQNLHASFTSY